MKIHDDEVLCQAMAVTTDRYVVQAPVAISFQIAAIWGGRSSSFEPRHPRAQAFGVDISRCVNEPRQIKLIRRCRSIQHHVKTHPGRCTSAAARPLNPSGTVSEAEVALLQVMSQFGLRASCSRFRCSGRDRVLGNCSMRGTVIVDTPSLRNHFVITSY